MKPRTKLLLLLLMAILFMALACGPSAGGDTCKWKHAILDGSGTPGVEYSGKCLWTVQGDRTCHQWCD